MSKRKRALKEGSTQPMTSPYKRAKFESSKDDDENEGASMTMTHIESSNIEPSNAISAEVSTFQSRAFDEEPLLMIMQHSSNHKSSLTEITGGDQSFTPDQAMSKVSKGKARSSASYSSSSTAAHRLFNTTELLEQILQHQDVEGLMSMRRVSHKWKDVIEETPSLRRAMFLDPMRPEELSKFKFDGSPFMLQLERVWPDYDADAPLYLQPSDPDRNPSATVYICNPVLLTRHHYLLHSMRANDQPFRNNHFTSRLLRSKSPFLDMFITQPPIHEVAVIQYGVIWNDSFTQFEPVKNPKGVKVRDVLRAGDRMFGYQGWNRRYLHVPKLVVSAMVTKAGDE